MQHIKSYIKKIDAMVEGMASRKKSASPSSSGLLSPTGESKQQSKKTLDGADLVAVYVKAIRSARKGMK